VQSFDDLVAEAAAAPFTGWDFSWMTARSKEEPLPWRYEAEVAARAAAATTMLDMGTGGGEQLARIDPRAPRTVATESWPPNVPVAASLLRPLGIPVVHSDGAPDNMSEEGIAARPEGPGHLPFRDGAFDLVINRHESFRGDELARVMATGGTFITQQVDMHSYDDLYRLLGLEPPEQPDSWLPLAVSQLTSAGLIVTTAAAGVETTYFDHIGAVVYYLKVVDWGIPEYSLDAFLPQLRAAWQDESAWPRPVRQRRFLVVAEKPRAAARKEDSDGR
jgi:hypothetical protein